MRFLKDSIQGWPYDATGKPTNVAYDAATCLFSVKPMPGVYQALSTIKGAEILSADQY